MACAFFAIVTTSSFAGQWEYQVVNIGQRYGYARTADKINNAGQVVGRFRMKSDLSPRGYLYSRGKIVDLGPVWPMDVAHAQLSLPKEGNGVDPLKS